MPAAPEGEDWLHEIKFDGYRVQALIESGAARILTRSGLDWTTRFGDLAVQLAQLRIKSAALDGEAVVLDENGVSRFALLQAALGRADGAHVTMMCFDLMNLDGRNLTRLPLRERKAALAKLLATTPHAGRIRYVDHLWGHGQRVLAKVCDMGLEGIVSKHAGRPYRSGRHGDWTKTKCIRSDPFVVVGYTTQKGTTAIVGALVLGFYEGGKLVYSGRVGTGFTLDEARAMAHGLGAIRAAPPAFARQLSRDQLAGVRWIKASLVAQVAWRDVTPDGLLRHTTFQHFRTDKIAREIHRPSAFHGSS